MNADLSKENLRARLKKEIIQNNIYGVDIEEGAIEIARLRFWLSLVIELDTPEPLPNFDYKFMQGNSLLESTMLPGTKKPFNLNIQEMLKEKILFPHFKTALKQLHNELNLFYGETDHIKKQASRKAIKEHVIEVLNACVDSEPTKVQEIAEIAAKTKDDFTCTDFFLWHTWFADVFGLDISEDSVAVSNKDGFDIVIGNPPYIGLGGDLNKIYSPYKYVEPKQNAKKKSTVTAVDAVYKFKTHNGNGDIYCLFYEWGRELLKENGHLCYITSNKWMRAGYGEALRDLLAKETNPMILIDFGGVKVFENATVDVNILLFEKTDKNLGLTMCSVGGSDKEVIDAYKIAKRCQDAKDISITEKIQYFLSDYMYRGATVMKFNSSKAWVISSSSVFEQIKTKIEKVGIALGDERWNIRINYGIKTGFNDAFIISTEKRDEILANTADYVLGKALEDYDPQGEYARTDALIRPILRGRDIKRYGYDWAGLWVINTHNGLKQNRKVIVPRVDINDYPAVKAHLDSYKTKLEDRADQGDTPYDLRNCAYINDFDLPKIVYQELTQGSCFCFDALGEYYVSNTAYLMVGNNLDYLIRLLNSKFVEYTYSHFYCVTLGKKGIRWLYQCIVNLPIPLFTNTPLQQEIVNTPTTNTKQIDALVYELYGITSYDELLEIEGDRQKALEMLILITHYRNPNATDILPLLHEGIASSDTISIIANMRKQGMIQ